MIIHPHIDPNDGKPEFKAVLITIGVVLSLIALITIICMLL
jgi:hypothetical protein